MTCIIQRSPDVLCLLHVCWYAIHFILWAAQKQSLYVRTCCNNCLSSFSWSWTVIQLAVLLMYNMANYTFREYANMMLLYGKAQHNGMAACHHTTIHLPTPSLSRFTSRSWRLVHSPLLVLHGGAVLLSWKRLYTMQWKRMRRQVPNK